MKLVACLVLLGLVARVPAADACSCRGPFIYGVPQVKAPINTRVILWVPSPIPRDAFTVREADQPGQLIATSRRDSGTAAMFVVELVPAQPLRPLTAYEVLDAKGAVVHRFETSDATDTERPRWRGASRVEFVREKAVCCNCSTGNPFAAFAMAPLVDDITPESALVFAIWVAGAKGQLDYARPPTTIMPGPRFPLGDPSTCGSSTFDFPRATSLKVGIKALDLAGHESWPVELRFAIAKPRLRPRR